MKWYRRLKIHQNYMKDLKVTQNYWGWSVQWDFQGKIFRRYFPTSELYIGKWQAQIGQGYLQGQLFIVLTHSKPSITQMQDCHKCIKNQIGCYHLKVIWLLLVKGDLIFKTKFYLDFFNSIFLIISILPSIDHSLFCVTLSIAHSY